MILPSLPLCDEILERAHILPAKDNAVKSIIARFYCRDMRALCFMLRKEFAPKEAVTRAPKCPRTKTISCMKAIHYYYFCYFYPYIAPTAHRVPTKSHILFSYPVRTFLVYLATTIFSYFHCIFSYFFLYLVRIFLVYLATAIFLYFFVFFSYS